MARKKIYWMSWGWRAIKLSRGRLPIPMSKAKGVKRKVRLILKKCISRLIPSSFVLRYIKMCQEFEFEKSSFLANYTTMQNGFREWQPKSSMDRFVLHQFERGQFYIMEDYNVSLSHLYDNYMELPPIEKRVAHDINSFYWR